MAQTILATLKSTAATAIALSANDLATLNAKIVTATGDETSRVTRENKTFRCGLDLATITAMTAYVDNLTSLAGETSISLPANEADAGLATFSTAVDALATALGNLDTAITALIV